MRIVIMGGTAGIGKAVALQQAATGAEVIVTGRDAGRLAEMKEYVASAEQVDGADENEVAAFFERTGPIDHLVLAFSPNAVGLGPIAGASMGDLRAAFEGKVIPYLYAIQQAQVTGSVTLISAISARAAMPGTAILAAVNGAIERAVSPLAAELAPLRVNAVSPGVIDTAWWSFLGEEAREAQFAELSRSIPAGRVGTPDEVASAIGYLIGATYVSGKVLAVDGGATVA